MGKRQDEATGSFEGGNSHTTVPVPETYGGDFSGAEQVETHRAVGFDAERVAALELMKSSFSGNGEAITFQLPMKSET